MSTEALLAEIEADLEWRQAELRLLQNQIALVTVIEEQDILRRPLVVMLYAHFEGFCKFVFLAYIKAINEAGISCRDAHYALVATSIADVFKTLRNPESKCREFRNELPHDAKLHRFAREREYLERTDEIFSRVVSISDDVVDLEGNVKPVVLRKALYQLGFTHDQFDAYEGTIHQLLESRNGIAHGRLRSGIDEAKYTKLRDHVFDVLNGIKRDVGHAILNQKYRKAS